MVFPIGILLSLAPALLKAGAPMLAQVIRNGLPEQVGSVVDAVASSLGVAPTPEAIVQRIEADPVSATPAVQRVETERSEDWAAMIAQINTTMRSEQTAEGWLQRNWRPIFGIIFGANYGLIATSIAFTIFKADGSMLNALSEATGLIVGIEGVGAAVMGVAVYQRSQEKKAGVSGGG